MDKTVTKKASQKPKGSASKTGAEAEAAALPAYRTHSCGALRRGDVGGTARLSGWVHRVRDHGGLLFIDLRDHYGITQCVVEPESPAFKAAERVRAEWVIRVDGKVEARTVDTVNANMPTGEIELRISAIEVLSEADELPLPVFGEPDYPEDTRLKYRFLDLRRETLHRNIMKRSAIIASLRRRMTEAGFFEFQTPILTASSPEGARDFLVPSRIHPGKFYALPQAPQQFKQLIMMAGFDRYFQIAPCFRDEDARADRSSRRVLPARYRDELRRTGGCVPGRRTGAARSVRRVRRRQAGDGRASRASPMTRRSPNTARTSRTCATLSSWPMSASISAAPDFKIFAQMLEKDAQSARVWAIPAPTGGSRAFCDRMNWHGRRRKASRVSAIFSGGRPRLAA